MGEDFMKRSKLIFGDVLFILSIKARRGEKIFDALRRQGKEIREARRKIFERAIRGGNKVL